LGRDLTELLGADDAELDQTGYTQPALFAVEYALAMMWLSWGGKPAAVLGHSLGEIVAACVAGVLDLPDAVRLVVERGRLMQALPAGGAMATLVCDEARAAAAIAGHPGRVAIAAVNGPADTVIAGPAVDLATITDALAADGVKTRLLRVSHAFHSPLMAPALDGLRAVAAGITHRPARLPLISNVTGRFWADEDRVDPDYWVRHAISPVRFADGIRTLHAAGYRTFLEIGPQPVLLGLGSRGLDDPACEWIPSLRRGHADQQRIMAALGALHLRGIAVDWPAFHRAEQVRRTPLPTYAWRGEPYWFRVPDQPRAIAAETGEPVAGVGRRVRGALPTYEIEPPDQPWRTAELTRIALLAAADGIGGGWHGVRTVTAGAPIPPDPDRVLRLVLTPDDDLGTTTFAYHSATPAEEATGAPWRRHQSGMLTRRPVSADEPADPITIEAPTGESWQDPAELLMRMRWDPVPATAPVDLAGRGFLLLSNGNPLAEELSAELRRRGGTCVIAPSTDAAGDADHVVLLDGLDTPSSTADAADVLAYRDRADLRTVAVLQEILDRPARLCLLTRGAVDTGADQAGQDPFGGTLWGIGRVLALEHPEHWGGAIDLDPDAGTDVALLADALATVADEDQQALRGRSRLVARVVHSGLSAAELRAEVAVRPDGAYLITGAFGGIGRAVARWLAARGAGKLIMAGRTALPDRATWDDPALPDSVLTRVRAVRELERLGAEVDVVAIDVADADAVRALVATSTAGHRPLRGVLHAAGVSLPQFARDVRVAEYDQVWRPKVLGGWALHRATLDCELDFFLSFSSVAATWGSQHLTSYAAANGFLDALAAHRRSVGRPALTVAWSSWELESSLFDADVVEFITATGMRLLSAPQCLRLAGALLAGDETHHIVCAADWAKYKSIMEARAERPVFRAITVAADESGDADPAALTGQLLATPSGQRRAVVDGYLRAQLAQILRLDAGALTGEFHLLEMGLDSLMVMELIGRVRKDLAIDMKSPDFFACDANEWADFLLRLVETQHEALVA
jgi:acyl transferase domain-containing protein/acyl carrier protein